MSIMLKSEFLRHNTVIIAIIIFLSSFFLMILVTTPGLHFNDEWISTNQLNQLVQGHQILFSEGKYGTQSGEITRYFETRSNVLGYSISLPIFAIGPMLLFMILGDSFRLGIIFFWSIIPVFIAILIHVYFPQFCRWGRISILIPAIFISLILLFINASLYYPFSSSIITDPIESASLVFTANILFSVLCVILFFMGMEIFHEKKKAIVFAFSILACSSYLFWGTSGKDHILSIVFVALVLFYFIKYIHSNSRVFACLGFLFLGITAWVRPELGFSLFIFISLFFLGISFLSFIHGRSLYQSICEIMPIFAFFAGLVPFFINNCILTGNFLLSPFLYYMSSLTSTATTDSSVSLEFNEGIVNAGSMYSGFTIEHLFSFIRNFYSINTPSVIIDLKGIFFFADNGSMPVAALAPFLCVGLFSLGIFLFRKKRISNSDLKIIILSLFIISGIFLAYLRSFHALHVNPGMAPDIRYLAPLYLPGGIIGLIAMKYWRYCPIDTMICKKSIIEILVLCIMVLLVTLCFEKFGGGFYQVTYFYSLVIFGLVFLYIIQFCIMELSERWNENLLRLNFILLLVIPLIWQIIIVSLYSMARFNGYDFWIPVSQYMVNWYIFKCI